MKIKEVKFPDQPESITIEDIGKYGFQVRWYPDAYRQIRPTIQDFIEILQFLENHNFTYDGMSYDTGYYGEVETQYLQFNKSKK